MKALTIKELAPYLPYGLKVMITYDVDDSEILILGANDRQGIIGISSAIYQSGHNAQPVLRPLSSLTKEIKHNGEVFVPLDRLGVFNSEFIEYLCEFKGDLASTRIEYAIVQLLFEWHFDVFNLIENNLAEPIKE